MSTRKPPQMPDYSAALTSLRGQNFTVSEAGDGRARVERDGCAAEISRSGDKKESGAIVSGRPGVLLGGAIATLLDRGFQKFFVTPKLTVAATADKLKALHAFEEGLAEALGRDQSYNEALGTVSDSYMYDRVKGRADAPVR